MRKRQEKVLHFVIVILVVVVVVTVSFLLKMVFSTDPSELTVEILAAVLGVVLVVASVGVTMHFQNQAEIERGFRIELFQSKVKMYRDLLDCVTKIDDDGRIDDKEIEEVRNRARVVALVASPQLVKTLAAFVERLDSQRQLSTCVEGADAFRSVVQAMREDLDVVEGDVTGDVKRLVDR